MKVFNVHHYIDDTHKITNIKEKNYYPLPYYQNAKDYFIESQMNCGLGEDEAQDLFNENSFPKIETFLKKSGYDL